jgi:hypothetical protein
MLEWNLYPGMMGVCRLDLVMELLSSGTSSFVLRTTEHGALTGEMGLEVSFISAI